MSLFRLKEFTSHSGMKLPWKLECESLTSEDWDCIAWIISQQFNFYRVIGIPNGGLALEKALTKYCCPSSLTTLIVDDVHTTGKSLEEMKAKYKKIEKNCKIQGVVLFSRNISCANWIQPVFGIWP